MLISDFWKHFLCLFRTNSLRNHPKVVKPTIIRHNIPIEKQKEEISPKGCCSQNSNEANGLAPFLKVRFFKVFITFENNLNLVLKTRYNPLYTVLYQI